MPLFLFPSVSIILSLVQITSTFYKYPVDATVLFCWNRQGRLYNKDKLGSFSSLETDLLMIATLPYKT